MERMISFVSLPSSLSFRNLMYFPYGTRPRIRRKFVFKVVIMCSLVTMALSATDCGIIGWGSCTCSLCHYSYDPLETTQAGKGNRH
jgi:hypothetical protein